MPKKNYLIAILLLSIVSSISYAASSVEFFASNNTATIDMQTAYLRLKGKEQINLQDTIIQVMQKNHIEQGKFADILGTYQMANDRSMTADNSDAFISSPYQNIQAQKVFSIAKQIANSMRQESVAVFIPSNKPVIGELKVSFTSHEPTIKEIVNLIHDKLPAIYSQAYSLHLKNENIDFDHAKVSEVEWLGSKINMREISNAFPLEKISYQNGTAYLIFKNGQKSQL